MTQFNQEVREYLRHIGREGGRRSRRRLSPEQARAMVRVREARRAFREFRSRCFWSAPAGFEVGTGDVEWVVERLRKNGGRAGWEAARKLCR